MGWAKTPLWRGLIDPLSSLLDSTTNALLLGLVKTLRESQTLSLSHPVLEV
jgi:hypothetical protein